MPEVSSVPRYPTNVSEPAASSAARRTFTTIAPPIPVSVSCCAPNASRLAKATVRRMDCRFGDSCTNSENIDGDALNMSDLYSLISGASMTFSRSIAKGYVVAARWTLLALALSWPLSSVKADPLSTGSYLNCQLDALFQAGFELMPAALTLTSIPLSGTEENIIPPGTTGLEFLPDEHMSFIQEPLGSYRLWASAGGTYGTVLFQTSNLGSLGTPQSVFGPSGPGTTAFDADYAGPGSILPAVNGTDLLMIYHAENHLFSGTDYPGTPFYAGIGLARSTDGGATWHRQGEIISAHDPQEATQSSPGAGASTPAAILADGFIYVVFREIDLQSGVSGFAIARSPVSSDAAPGSWHKYESGAFSSPGLGGSFTALSLVLDPQALSDQPQPHLSFNTYLHQFVMTMVGNGGIYVLTSADLLTWTTGIVALPAQYPDKTVTDSEVHDWYPTLISPGNLTDRCTDQSGYLYYAKFLGDGTSHHYLYRQAYSITGQ